MARMAACAASTTAVISVVMLEFLSARDYPPAPVRLSQTWSNRSQAVALRIRFFFPCVAPLSPPRPESTGR